MNANAVQAGLFVIVLALLVKSVGAYLPASGTSREITANRDNQNVLCFVKVARSNWNRLQPKRRIAA